MEVFTCTCPQRQLLFFENTHCQACGRTVGFSWHEMKVVPEDELIEPLPRCGNWVNHNACNCFVEDGDPSGLCRACRLNEVIPDLRVEKHLELWGALEVAKRRCLYTLRFLGLSWREKQGETEETSEGADSIPGLAFYFLTDSDVSTHFQTPLEDTPQVMTGHENGKITINLAEADDIARTQTRVNLGEEYRTLLGHFRHEVGHYYWEVLIQTHPERLQRFRELFGDEQASYAEALERHYHNPPPAGWETQFISAYATMHPWEDWAETWAHYLHMVDALHTARSYRLEAHLPASTYLDTEDVDHGNFDSLYQSWVALSLALNSLNRSMGQDDAYPFVLSDAIKTKLRFVHDVIACKP